MQLAYALTALAAEMTPDGKLWLLGGDFDTLGTPALPLTQPHMALVVKLWAQPTECQREHRLSVELLDADGHEHIQRLEGAFQPAINPKAPGRRIAATVVLNFQGLQFANPGDYAFHILVDDLELGTVPLTITQTQAPPG